MKYFLKRKLLLIITDNILTFHVVRVMFDIPSEVPSFIVS